MNIEIKLPETFTKREDHIVVLVKVLSVWKVKVNNEQIRIPDNIYVNHEGGAAGITRV